MAQWIRPQTLNHEVPGSNLLATAVVPLGKILHPQFNSIQFNSIKKKIHTVIKTHTEHVRFFGAPREAKLVSGAQINY